MTGNHHKQSSWADRHRKDLTTRHTHEDVLTAREFELLLEACATLPEPRDLQARFICLASGRLGLRGGEIAHFQTNWLNWDRSILRVPKHEPCSCGYCRRQAAQEATHHDELTTEEALKDRWHPKTATSARAVPFDLSLRVELCIERFADRYDKFPLSRSTVNRRVDTVADEADIDGRVYPHSLRATAASYHAYQGGRPSSIAGANGMERFGYCSEIHPHFRDCDG